MKECGCKPTHLCAVCIKNHEGSLYGYTVSLDVFNCTSSNILSEKETSNITSMLDAWVENNKKASDGK